MSRWTTSFNSDQFHASFEKLNKVLNLIDIKNITCDSTLQEIARIKKAIEYIDSYIKLIDPDINILNTLNNLDRYIINTTNELSSFNLDKNTTHIQRANSSIDVCLNTIKNFHTVLPKVSGQGIFSMLKKYNETLEEALFKIDLPSVIKSSNEIDKLKEKLFDGTDDENSVEVKIKNMLDDTEKKHTELLDYYNNTLNDSKQSGTTKEIIENAKNDITKYLKTSKDESTEISTKIDNLNKFYVKIFGELNNKDERVGGLKSELNSRIKNLDDFEKTQQKTHEETLVNKLKEIKDYEQEQQLQNKNLFKQIESLLPSATSAGLAKAYHDERNKFKNPIFLWNIAFVVSLSIIQIVSFITFKELQTLEDFGRSMLHSLPISGPLIWLAIYSSKRRSENQRLEQEYAHKEAFAKSYSSYKQQIEGLKQEDQELLTRLLDTAIATMSYNASETLDKKHGDSTPAQEIAKSLTGELKK